MPDIGRKGMKIGILLMVIGCVVFAVSAITHECKPWNPQQQAAEWAAHLGLTGLMIDCYEHNDSCHAECSVGHDANKDGTARMVTSITCSNPDNFGDAKGKCWKVEKR